MERQMTVAISDAVLAISSCNACVKLSHVNLTAVLGFFLIGSAAVLGVRRFAAPDNWIIEKHKYMSWLATVLGMSCVAAAYYRSATYSSVNSTVANVHIACSAAVVLLRQFAILSGSVLNVATEAVSSAAVISTLLYSVWTFNPFGIIGSALYIFAGLAIKTEGELFSVLRVNWFHYVLAVANVSLMIGLNQTGEPVLYRRH